MHRAFWKHVAAGLPPAPALFEAKKDYLAGIPYGGQSAESEAQERKTHRQFICLGLGW